MTNRFVLNPERGKILGISAGLSEWLGIDVLTIRLAMIVAALITGPIAIVLYLVTGWLATDKR